jgi:predicted RNA-binding protein with PUA-like domain
MDAQYWLVKQEPTDYSWDDFEREGETSWTGVRNFQARNNLRGMKKGDLVLFYHSGENREVVGVARVAREAYPDPTAREGDWSAVDLKPVKKLAEPVTLQRIKGDPAFKEMPLVRTSRLSVMPITAAHFSRIVELSGTKLTR